MYNTEKNLGKHCFNQYKYKENFNNILIDLSNGGIKWVLKNIYFRNIVAGSDFYVIQAKQYIIVYF